MTLEKAVAAWNEDEIFRATFLHHFTRREDREVLAGVGRLLTELWTEGERWWPQYEGSALRREFEAWLADQTAAYQYLRVVAAEPQASQLDPADQHLALASHELAERLRVVIDDGRQALQISRQLSGESLPVEEEPVPEGACPSQLGTPAPGLRLLLGAVLLGSVLWIVTKSSSQ